MKDYINLFFICLITAAAILFTQYCSERILAEHITKVIEDYQDSTEKRIIHDEHINKFGPLNWIRVR